MAIILLACGVPVMVDCARDANIQRMQGGAGGISGSFCVVEGPADLLCTNLEVYERVCTVGAFELSHLMPLGPSRHSTLP